MFRGERVKAPGLFGADPLQDESALLMREAVQNSWDAALESRNEAASAGAGGPRTPIPFEVRFRLFELSGTERDRCAEVTGLHDLARRVASVEDRRTLGLGEQDCLDGLGDDVPLPMLEISERAAGGMHGPWGEESKLYRALCSFGITPATPGRGGSFGYGKAGLIRGSAIRTVLAYTCFAEHADDPGVTRRLLGMTYWGAHKDEERRSCIGVRWLARLDGEGECRPYENDDADAAADLLGLARRSPDDPADLGTTFLLVDPTVTSDGLLRAAERFWWPALNDQTQQFEISVMDESAGGGGAPPRGPRTIPISCRSPRPSRPRRCRRTASAATSRYGSSSPVRRLEATTGSALWR
ncbi:MAG: hypothetical protein F4076_08565 [Acidimicrobiaceae bacterium]|nr:hypothetical protein [Acidimicrobiaceae bacterium]